MSGLNDDLATAIEAASADGGGVRGEQWDVDNDIIRSLFSSQLGASALHVLSKRYLAPTRWQPAEEPALGYYREGMAQVVADIMQIIGEDRNG